MGSFIAVLLLLTVPSLAGAASRPDWAFPTKPAEVVPTPPDDGKPKRVRLKRIARFKRKRVKVVAKRIVAAGATVVTEY